MTQAQFDAACSRVLSEFVQRKIGEARTVVMEAFGAPVAVQAEPSKVAPVRLARVHRPGSKTARAVALIAGGMSIANAARKVGMSAGTLYVERHRSKAVQP